MSVVAQAPTEAPPFQWFGVTIGSQAFLVCAEDRERALTYAFLAISDEAERTREAIFFASPHDGEISRSITLEYGSRRQVIPVAHFTRDMLPGSRRVFFDTEGKREALPHDNGA